MTNQPKIIKGQKDCIEYLKSIGLTVTLPTLKKYIEVGLPCWYEFGTYHFHTEVIDDFFKVMCRQRMTEAPDEIENGDRPI